MTLKSGYSKFHQICLLLAVFIILTLLHLPMTSEGAVSGDVEVYDIDPVGSYEQNLSADQRATFVFVVKNKAKDCNVTIILSNSSQEPKWHVESSEDMFVLGPNSSRVVRVNIWPEKYRKGSASG